MKQLLYNIIAFLILITPLKSQYLIQSPYLTNPVKTIDYVDSCAQFWENAHDDTYGGFYVEISREGYILNNSYKGLVSLSRDAYGFTRAYMMTGNESYLEMAHSALNFMYSHLWDENYNGWYSGSNRSGTVPYGDIKTAFDQHYALLGIIAHYEATGDTMDWKMLSGGFDFNEGYLWDNRDDYFGYYDRVSIDGSAPMDKSFNATVDAITTHLYSLYLLTGDEIYRSRLLDLKDNIINHLIASMDYQVIGFAENYNSDWNILSGGDYDRTIMGHVLKTAWCLGRIYRMDQNEIYLDGADVLIQDVLTGGYDYEYGGPYKDFNRLTGEMYMYGAYDTAKAWWQMEQAVTSGLVLYNITDNEQYLQMADESLDFFMKYFVDHTYGEVYADRSRTGGRVYYGGGYWDENKGSNWKAAYHSIETGYYVYLYGKLIINNQPVTLYYKYDPLPYERTFKMTPLAVDFTLFKIAGVQLNENEYTNFNRDERTLTLPSNTGGVFKVTYEMGIPELVTDSGNPIMDGFELYSSYPNPFNPSTTISYRLGKPTHVILTVYNPMGQVINILVNGYQSEGPHEVHWNAGGLNSGIYFYNIQAGNFTANGKCLLLK